MTMTWFSSLNLIRGREDGELGHLKKLLLIHKLERLGSNEKAVIYIETAKENHLDSYRYLLRVMKSAPKLSLEDSAWAEKLLPELAPDECKSGCYKG